MHTDTRLGLATRWAATQTARDAAQHLIVIVAIAIGTIWLRLPSLGKSVIDWDESIYLLVARGWLRGTLPYTAIWDHKPPGLYLGFAAAQLVFGQRVAAIRGMLCVVAGLSAYGLYRLGRDALHSRGAGILAAALYMVCSLQNEGTSGHPEMLFSPLVIYGFWLTLRAGPQTRLRPGQLLPIGLVFGAAMQIKFSVLFDFAAALVVLVGPRWQRERTLARRTVLGQIALVGIGFLIPVALVSGYFALNGQFGSLYEANISANARYVQLQPFSLDLLTASFALELTNYPFLWLAALCAPLLLLRRARSVDRAGLLVLLVWMAGSAAAIGLSKLFFENYYLQILPPLCLLTGYVVVASYRLLRERGARWAALLPLLFAAAALLSLGWEPLPKSLTWARQRRYKQPDTPALVADYLRRRLAPGQTIFVADYEPILYYMLDVPLPTRYIVPRVLTTDGWARLAQIDRTAELAAIMQQRPQFVIVPDQLADERFAAELGGYLARYYAKSAAIREAVVYQRIE